MELIILGSGSYQPELRRHSSSYLVKVGKENLVFDFGRGVLDQLMKVGVDYSEIDAIFISHTHADHLAELSSFLHIATAQPAKGKLRKKDITIYGPKGIKDAIEHLVAAFDLKLFKPKYKIIVKELSSSQVTNQNWLVKNYKVKHIIKNLARECLAYRVESKGKVWAYSGDTDDCPGLRQACKNADLAVIEASWPKEIVPKLHLTAEKAGKIAQDCQVKKLVLTHISPYYLANYPVKKLAQKYYHGPIVIAKDLMKIKI